MSTHETQSQTTYNTLHRVHWRSNAQDTAPLSHSQRSPASGPVGLSHSLHRLRRPDLLPPIAARNDMDIKIHYDGRCVGCLEASASAAEAAAVIAVVAGTGAADGRQRRRASAISFSHFRDRVEEVAEVRCFVRKKGPCCREIWFSRGNLSFVNAVRAPHPGSARA